MTTIVDDTFFACDMLKFFVSLAQGASHLIIVGLLFSSLAPASGNNFAVESAPTLIYLSAAVLFARDLILWIMAHESLWVDFPVILVLVLTVGVLVFTLGEYLLHVATLSLHTAPHIHEWFLNGHVIIDITCHQGQFNGHCH